MPHVGHVPGQVGDVAYGVVHNGDDAGNFDYIAGIAVKDFSGSPAEFARLRIPEQRYAVFTHREHISGIRRTMNAIWNDWLYFHNKTTADAPSLERANPGFNTMTGKNLSLIFTVTAKRLGRRPGRTWVRISASHDATCVTLRDQTSIREGKGT